MFRVVFVYLVAAWLILQIADLISPILGVPEWSSKLIFLLLILGFPFALILAWAYEMTPDGLKKEKDIDRDESITKETGRQIDYVIIAALVVALAYNVIFVNPDSNFDLAISPVPILAEGGTHSIAVLPLVNMSSDTETDYFSDGLAEELLNLLAKVDSLRVAARTSSFAYKGQNRNIQEIGKELNVGYLLEGSVRRSGDKVRITTQLVSVADGFHLWSETYDGDLTDIFALQDEIAAAVVKALRIELLNEEISPERVAIDPAAYDLFLRGRGELNENVAGSLERAADYLNRAIELEPDYAAAMALLASTYLDMDEFGSLSITESLRLSGPLIEKALELDPNQASAWAAQGYRQLRLDQYGLAAESLRRALELAPSDIRALGNYASVLRTQGRFRDNLEIIRTLSELDPQNPNHAVAYEYARAYLGENEQIDKALDRLRERYPDDPRFHDGSATYYRASQQYDRMTRDMLSMRVLRPADAWAPGNISAALYKLGAADAGDQWLETTRQVNPDSRYLTDAIYQKFVMQKQYGELTNLMRDAWLRETTEANYRRLGSALLLDGKPAEAYELLKESLQKFAYEPESGNVSLTTDAALWLIVAARATGDDVLASNLIGKAGTQVSNVVEQRMYVLDDQSSWAAYYALAGQRIRALYTLQQAAEKGFAVPEDLETPFFDLLQDNPDFEAILEQVRNNQAAMRRKVLALDNLLPGWQP